MSTHNIHFHGEIRKLFTLYPHFSGAMTIFAQNYLSTQCSPRGVVLSRSPVLNPDNTRVSQ